MQAVTKVVGERDAGEVTIDATGAGDIARWLRSETGADAVRITTFERLPGGMAYTVWYCVRTPRP